MDDADRMVSGEPPIREFAPIIVCEITSFGWRGLTQDGEILEVNGNRRPQDDYTIVDIAGRAIGVRTIAKPTTSPVIDTYHEHFRRSAKLVRENKFKPALKAIDQAIRLAPTVRARHNRGLILLALGRWREGFAEYAFSETQYPFARPVIERARQAGLKLWNGEKLTGKRLALIHAHGFGDTIMMLRFVPELKTRGADVKLIVPPALASLAAQFAPLADDARDCDYGCSILQAMGPLGVTPDNIPSEPYLPIDPTLFAKWQNRTFKRGRPRIGLAWTVGKIQEQDYPRSIPLERLVLRFGKDADLFSVQQQYSELARAHGVTAFEFESFADCAAFMSTLDAIVTVDTAAAHLAGAIGHPSVHLLLSHWHSWRWQARWYGLKQYAQDVPGDWASALAKLPL